MRYTQWQGLQLKEGLADSLQSINFVIFDVDGVLVDAKESYPRAIRDAVQHYAATLPQAARAPKACTVELDHIPLFKAAGGFNDEWILTYAACLWLTWCHFSDHALSLSQFMEEVANAGGGIEAAQLVMHARAGSMAPTVYQWCRQDVVTRLAQEYYAGSEDTYSLFGIPPQLGNIYGHHHLERDLLSPREIDPWADHVALYTGRNDPETEFVLARSGLHPYFPSERRITASSGITKPNPAGLELLIGNAPKTRALFVGDTMDDLRSAQNFQAQHPQEQTLWFAGVTGGSMGESSANTFAEHGADLIVPSVNALLTALFSLRHSA